MLRTINASTARRIHATALPVPRLTAIRGYASPSTPRAKPSAAAVEAHSHDFAPPAFMSIPRPEPVPHKFNPMPSPPKLRKEAINLPPPLPSDAVGSNRLNAELYRPTSALDTVSLLSICSSRAEFVPRAYQIFTSLLTDAEQGNAYMPKTQIWANVVHGVAQLCKPATTIAGEKVAELWRYRTKRLIHSWEKVNGYETGEAALDKDGILVYRAWFSALVK